MAVTITITDEQLQQVFNQELSTLLETGNYRNPVKKALDSLLGYNSELTGVIGEQIKSKLESFMEDKEFQRMLGEYLAKFIAERHVKSLEKKIAL